MEWIRYLKFDHEAHNRVLVDYVAAVENATVRLVALTKDIVDLVETCIRSAPTPSTSSSTWPPMYLEEALGVGRVAHWMDPHVREMVGYFVFEGHSPSYTR